MADHRTLRPLERCVLRLVDDGVDDAEIGRRFRRRPEFVRRVIAYTRIPRDGRRAGGGATAPAGASDPEVARRWRRPGRNRPSLPLQRRTRRADRATDGVQAGQMTLSSLLPVDQGPRTVRSWPPALLRQANDERVNGCRSRRRTSGRVGPCRSAGSEGCVAPNPDRGILELFVQRRTVHVCLRAYSLEQPAPPLLSIYRHGSRLLRVRDRRIAALGNATKSSFRGLRFTVYGLRYVLR